MNDDPRRRRRRRRRGRPASRAGRGVLYDALGVASRFVKSLYAALGLVIIIGAVVAFSATWAFAEIAESVQRGGGIQEFDDAVLLWISEHRMPVLEAFLIELTVLGSWVVIAVVVGVAALFLSIFHRRWSVLLLLVSSAGGIVITQLLKYGFDRERPQLFEWADHVVTSAFPSGHAASAAIAYGTIAYLVARLHERALLRWLILVIATLIILMVSASRLYLGVHYPSDVLAGLLIGVGWAAFCMAALEATQRYARHRVPELAETDVDEAAEEDPAASGAATG